MLYLKIFWAKVHGLGKLKQHLHQSICAFHIFNTWQLSCSFFTYMMNICSETVSSAVKNIAQFISVNNFLQKII